MSKTMTERPILFSAPMVRAILAGTKTQTRRVVKPLPLRYDAATNSMALDEDAMTDGRIMNLNKYGQPGNRLWVRETCRADELPDGLDGVRYLADEAFIAIQSNRESADRWLDLRYYGKRQSTVAPVKTVPAIHMPRWASRITLEVTGVRVERLQDVSDADAIAEGAEQIGDTDGAFIAGYRRLWESINGPGSWDANPWVWVVEFKRLEPRA